MMQVYGSSSIPSNLQSVKGTTMGYSCFGIRGDDFSTTSAYAVTSDASNPPTYSIFYIDFAGSPSVTANKYSFETKFLFANNFMGHGMFRGTS